MSDAVLQIRLRRRHFVIGRQRQLAIGEVEDGVGTPVHRVGDATAGLSSAAPFVGEQDFGAIVAECRGVPVGVVGIADGIDAFGIDGVGDIQQDSIARAGAGGEPDGGVDGDVVALVGGGGGLRALAVSAALPKSVYVARLGVGENARAGDDFGLFRVGERDLDDIDTEERGLGVGLRVAAGAAGEFFGLADGTGAGDVHVDVVFILGVDQQAVGVRPAAALHGGDLLRVLQIADIENAHATEAIRAGGRGAPCGASSCSRSGRLGRRRLGRGCIGWNRNALRAAIDAPIHGFGRHEEQVAIDGDVALSAGADERSAELDLGRVIDIVKVDAVVVAHKQMVAVEGEIGIDGAGVDGRSAPGTPPGRRIGGRSGFRRVGIRRKSRRLLQARDFLQAEDRLAGVEQSRLESHAGIVRAGARVGIDLRRRGLGGIGLRSSLRRGDERHGERCGERDACAKTAEIACDGHFFSLPSMPRMILISALWVFSMSVAKSNRTGS